MPAYNIPLRYSGVARVFQSRTVVIIVLVLSVLLTVVGALFSYNYALAAAEERFDLKVEQLRLRILDRFMSYEMVLRGATSLFDVYDGVPPYHFFKPIMIRCRFKKTCQVFRVLGIAKRYFMKKSKNLSSVFVTKDFQILSLAR